MAKWTLRVSTPDKSSIRATYTNDAPGGILDQFTWTCDGRGTSRQLVFNAVPSLVDIHPRDVIELLIGNSAKPAFIGYVVQAWGSDDKNSRQYVVIGLRSLLRQSYVPWDHYDYQDTGDLFKAIASSYNGPIEVDQSLIKKSGQKLEITTPGAVDFYTVLDDITKRTQGFKWGVTEDGKFFFDDSPGQKIEVPYSATGIYWLPIHAEDIVTKAIGWVGYASNPSDKFYQQKSGGNIIGRDIRFKNTKWPLVLTLFEDADHAIYGAEKAYAVSYIQRKYPDDGEMAADAWAAGGSFVINKYPTTTPCAGSASDVSALFDSSDSTYISHSKQDYSSSSGGIIYIDLNMPPGFWATAVEWRASVNVPTNQFGYGHSVSIKLANPDNPNFTYHIGPNMWDDFLPLLGNSPEKYTAWGFPPTDSLRFYLWSEGSTACVELKLHHVKIWGVWVQHPEDLGRALIVKPFTRPASVTFDGYVNPVQKMHIIGAPGGDVEGNIEEWEYKWGSQVRSSVARLAQPRIGAAAAVNQAAQATASDAASGIIVTSRIK